MHCRYLLNMKFNDWIKQCDVSEEWPYYTQSYGQISLRSMFDGVHMGSVWLIARK